MFVVKPVTVIRPHVAEVNVPVFVASPTAVAVYLVIVAPPLDAGVVQFTVTDVALATATAPIVGAPGTVAGVTAADAADPADVPVAFVAVTVNV